MACSTGGERNKAGAAGEILALPRFGDTRGRGIAPPCSLEAGVDEHGVVGAELGAENRDVVERVASISSSQKCSMLNSSSARA